MNSDVVSFFAESALESFHIFCCLAEVRARHIFVSTVIIEQAGRAHLKAIFGRIVMLNVYSIMTVMNDVSETSSAAVTGARVRLTWIFGSTRKYMDYKLHSNYIPDLYFAPFERAPGARAPSGPLATLLPFMRRVDYSHRIHAGFLLSYMNLARVVLRDAEPAIELVVICDSAKFSEIKFDADVLRFLEPRRRRGTLTR